jgi:hypothetical protein
MGQVILTVLLGKKILKKIYAIKEKTGNHSLSFTRVPSKKKPNGQK